MKRKRFDAVRSRERLDRGIEQTLRRVQTHLATVLALCLIMLVAFGIRAASPGELQVSQAIGFEAPPGAAGILALLALLLLNALFIGAETAIELLRPMHVKFLREMQSKHAERVQNLIDKADDYVAAMSLGGLAAKVLVVIVCIMLAPYALNVMHAQFGWPLHLGNLILSGVLLMLPVGFIGLILFELVPQSYAELHPQRVAAILYRFVRWNAVLFAPVSAIVTGVANLITARFGGRASFAIENRAEEEIKTIVETAEESGEIEQEEKELLHSVFEFTDTVAREVMTPRVDMDAMPVKSDPTEVMRVIQESGHSRIPLYEDTDDQVVGIIHAKDLLMALLNGKAPNLRSLMRPVLFVPENKNLHELLREMRQQRTQMAIVQDEFGGTAGILTIEDIVEELVGDIVDEYDVEEPHVEEVADGWIIDGRMHLDDVNHAIGSQLENDDFDTLGGYVFGLFGRQPALGEVIHDGGFRFAVTQTDGRRIARVKVEPVSQSAENEATPAP